MEKISGKLRLLLDALRRFDGDHGFLLSSGITFNFLICLIPLTLFLLASIGTYLYSSRQVLNHNGSFFGSKDYEKHHEYHPSS